MEAKVVEAKGYLAEATTMLAKAKSDLGRIRPREIGAHGPYLAGDVVGEDMFPKELGKCAAAMDDAAGDGLRAGWRVVKNRVRELNAEGRISPGAGDEALAIGPAVVFS